MLRKSTFLALVFLAAGAYAQDPAYLSGKLLQMNSVRCAQPASVVTGDKKEKATVANNTATSEEAPDGASTCFEYLLQADEVIYTIRPKNSQHESFLPVGEWAQFRINKDKLFLRVRSSESREREYVVISIKPRAENSADSIRLRLNHLQ